MPVYTFHIYSEDGHSPSFEAFEAFELDNDAATFAKAGDLLAQHLSCDHIEVWQGERGVVARHREQPIIRPVDEPV